MKTEELLKLAELAKAERDGETIQVRVFSPDRGPHWVSKSEGAEWRPSIENYRIKPEPSVIWVNRFKSGLGASVTGVGPTCPGWFPTKETAAAGAPSRDCCQVKFVEAMDDEPKKTAFEASVEDLIAVCVPDGQTCDTKIVADNIRLYFEAMEGEK